MSALARTPPSLFDDIHADVWRASALAGAPLQVQATGHAELDAQLPGGGWPWGTLVEILQPAGLHCEWRLLLPALAGCGPAAVLLVGAPHVPFAPALAAQGLQSQRLLSVRAPGMEARLWACEQALRCADINAVMAWLPQARADQLRRLQMAASEYNKLLFVMRPALAHEEASPATLRLQVQPRMPEAPPARQPAPWDAMQIALFKRRGPPLDQPLYLQARGARMRMQLAAGQAHALDCFTARH